MNEKLLQAVGQFVDNNYLTQYEIKGYYGFLYLEYEVLDILSSEKFINRVDFDVVDDEVVITRTGQQVVK